MPAIYTTAKLAVLLLLLALTSQATAQSVTNGLVLWVPMTEAGGLKVYDKSPSTIVGTLDAAVRVRDPLLGPAIQFDGANDAVTFGNVLAFERTQPFALVVTLKLAAQADMCIVCKSTGGVGYGLRTGTGAAPGKIKWLLGNATDIIEIHTSNNTTLDGKVHHVVALYDGSSADTGLALAVDGVIVPTTSQAFSNITVSIVTSDPLLLGNDTPYSRDLAGRIGMVAAYNRRLNTREIAQLYQDWRLGPRPALVDLASALLSQGRGRFFPFFQGP